MTTDELRSCSRTGCRWPAAACLSYDYASRHVWLLDLSAARQPSLYDLCPHHADVLTVPRGWQQVDDRTERPVVVEPSASDRAADARRRTAARRPSRRREEVLVGARGNRYAGLVADLPRVAAEVAAAPTVHGAAANDEPEPAGQLAIPVDDAARGRPRVVVPFDLGRRHDVKG